MAVMKFSAEEILRRTIEIEKGAQQFYRKTAAQTDDQHVKSVFELLAGMEGEHVLRFLQIREQLTEEEMKTEINDPGAEMHFYLDKFKEIQAAELHPGNGSTTTESRRDNAVDIVQDALIAEKETITFYSFLCNFVSMEHGLRHIMTIITEERQHVELLEKLLNDLRKINSVPEESMSA